MAALESGNRLTDGAMKPRRNLCPILGELCHASDFEEPNLFCKWSVQFGSSWKVIEGHCEGQSVANTARVDPRRSNFGTPLDLHLACRGIQVWPKLHVELIALNSFDNFWPVGYGFAFLPTQPGLHWIRMATWKVSSANSKSISDRFPAQNLPCHFPQFKN
ncbi:B9 domain-containing protein 2 [Culex quinquefasciatus]|uniref:B9 domain-containing protein 2 n=1 Tax=Culex quinquefasciatus TaxID=7176 RepID=UPI0018E2FEAF|nr:B9 domain-containing protein 2 [Culex quinquefasciatus]